MRAGYSHLAGRYSVIHIVKSRMDFKSMCGGEKINEVSGYTFAYLQNWVKARPVTDNSYRICVDCAVIAKLSEAKDGSQV